MMNEVKHSLENKGHEDDVTKMLSNTTNIKENLIENKHLSGSESRNLSPKTETSVAPAMVPAPKSDEFQLDFTTICQIQDTLDDYYSGPLVGLEYLLEVEQNDETHCPRFRCVLCGIAINVGQLFKHFICINHKSKYLETHFPTLHTQLINFDYSIIPKLAIVDKLCGAIERCYGRMRPVQCTQFHWEFYNVEICQAVIKREHFCPSKLGKTFIEIVEEPEYSKNSNSRSDESGDTTQSLQWWGHDDRCKTTDPKRRKIEANAEKCHAALPRRSRSPRRRTRSPRRRSRSPCRREHSLPQRSRSSRRRSRSPRRRERSPRRRERSPPRRARSPQRRTRSPRRRTRSPLQLNTFNDKKSSMANIIKYIKYKEKKKDELKESFELLDYHYKNPEKHPQYSEELEKFEEMNVGRLKTDSLKTDWVTFWAQRIIQLHDEKMEEKKKILRRQFNFPTDESPTRDTPTSEFLRNERPPIRVTAKSLSQNFRSARRRSRSPLRRERSSYVHRSCDKEERKRPKSREDLRSKPLRNRKELRRRSRSTSPDPPHRSQQIVTSSEDSLSDTLSDEESDDYDSQQKKNDSPTSMLAKASVSRPGYSKSKKEVKSVEEVKEQTPVDSTLAEHLKNPEKHPLYNIEWQKFWCRRCNEIKAENKDPASHDLKCEWIVFWTKRMIELHEVQMKTKQTIHQMQLDFSLEDSPTRELSTNFTSNIKVSPPRKTRARSRSPRRRSPSASQRSRSHVARRRRSPPPGHKSPYRRKPTQLRSKKNVKPSDNKSHEGLHSKSLNIRPVRSEEKMTAIIVSDDDSEDGKATPYDSSSSLDVVTSATTRPASSSANQLARFEALSSKAPNKPLSSEGPNKLLSTEEPSKPLSSKALNEPLISEEPSRPISSEEPSKPITPEDPSKPISSEAQSKAPGSAGPEEVLPALRQLAALEDYIGASLGPLMLNLLGEALRMEKEKLHSSVNILDMEEHTMLLEMVKEKLQGKVEVGLLGSAATAVLEVISRTTALLNLARRRKLERQEEEEADMKVGALQKVLVKRQVAATLLARSKTNMTSKELATLVDAVIDKAEARQRAAYTQHPVAAACFREKKKTDDTGNDRKMSTLEMLSQNKVRLKAKEKSPSRELNPKDQLSDSELQILLEEFEQISSDGGEGLEYNETSQVQEFVSGDRPTTPHPPNVPDLPTRIAAHRQPSQANESSQSNFCPAESHQDPYNTDKEVSQARKANNYTKQNDMAVVEPYSHQAKQKQHVEYKEAQVFHEGSSYPICKQADTIQQVRNMGGQNLSIISSMRPNTSNTHTQPQRVVDNHTDFHWNSIQLQNIDISGRADTAKWEQKVHSGQDKVWLGQSKEYGYIDDSNLQARGNHQLSNHYDESGMNNSKKDDCLPEEQLSYEDRFLQKGNSSQKEPNPRQKKFWQLFSKAKYDFAERKSAPNPQLRNFQQTQPQNQSNRDHSSNQGEPSYVQQIPMGHNFGPRGNFGQPPRPGWRQEERGNYPY